MLCGYKAASANLAAAAAAAAQDEKYNAKLLSCVCLLTMQYQPELQSSGSCKTAAHLVGSLQNVQQRQVQLLGVAVRQGLLE